MHRDPDCIGTWTFEYVNTMGLTFTTCSVCYAGTNNRGAAERENEMGKLASRLTREGRQFLK
jgi:hypothetical protein